MVLPLYADPRFAALYDTANSGSEDHDFYLEILGTAPARVLDMGCGTGRLARRLAAAGHETTGAEPSPAMLEEARRQPGAERVRWVLSGATELDLETRFDFIVLTGHVFQVFLEEETILAVLKTLRCHLALGGRLAFESRNPLVKEWESWRPEQTRDWLQVPGIGQVEVFYDIRAVEPPFVTYEVNYKLPDGSRLCAPDRLRFSSAVEIAGWLEASGFDSVCYYGDWDLSAVTEASPEIIAIAR